MFTTASAAAMILVSTSSLALDNRDVIADDAVLSSGVNLDQNGGNIPFAPGSLLTFNNADSVTADVNAIAGIYVNAIGLSMTFLQNTVVGCIVPPDLLLANHSLNMTIPAGANVTLNGVAPSQAAAAAAVNAAGGANPFAPGLGNNVPADTYFINDIDFQGTNGQLTIQAADNGDIVFAAETTDTTITNGLKAIVNVNSNLQVKDISWATGLGKINIGANAIYNYVNNLPNPIDVNPIGNLVFLDPTSRADFSNENGASTQFFATEALTSKNDAAGIVAFHVSTSATNITVPVGTSPTQRFNTFITDGENVTTISSNIFAQKIIIQQDPTKLGGQTQLIWTTQLNTGAGGLVQFNSNSISQFNANITSNMDFNGKSATAILDDGVTVTGDIDDIIGGNLATLNFVGGSTVTGDVGANHAINTLNVKGNNPVNLQGNVTVDQFNFTADGIAAVGGTLTATAGVQYNDLEATLAFSNPVGSYIFSSPILQAGNGGVMVDTTLKATDASIATAKAIQIGANFSTAALTLAVNNPNLNLYSGRKSN
ncbi:hypothetical protein [Rickettsia felis]|nr:hypothetical protein [Rickettsia felis]